MADVKPAAPAAAAVPTPLTATAKPYERNDNFTFHFLKLIFVSWLEIDLMLQAVTW